MSLLDFRKPNCVVLKSTTSWSGKYKIFYGHHYVRGHMCYDVGGINKENGLITSRHYNEHDYINQEHAKSEALRCYHELEKGMKRAPEKEEKDDNVFASDVFRSALKGRSN